MRVLLVGAVCGLALASVSPARAAPRIGDWEVDTKACVISQKWTADDGEGMFLGMGYINKGEYLMIAMGAANNKYKPEEELSFRIQIDDSFKTSGGGTAADARTGLAVLPASAVLIDALMQGEEMVVEVVGKPDRYSGTYALDDTDEALPALDSCRRSAP
jgi:hypothetical protein